MMKTALCHSVCQWWVLAKLVRYNIAILQIVTGYMFQLDSVQG